MCSAYVSFVTAIAGMPLADVVAIYFTMPLFVAGLAGMTLGEKVPLHRVAAIVVGFAGTLLMVRPGGDLFGPAALLALYSAFGYGDIVDLFPQAKERLRPGGRMYVLFSSDSDLELLAQHIQTTGFIQTRVAEHSIGFESFIIYELRLTL
jgi:drug/metabolite transporter (DMT)-like permease